MRTSQSNAFQKKIIAFLLFFAICLFFPLQQNAFAQAPKNPAPKPTFEAPTYTFSEQKATTFAEGEFNTVTVLIPDVTLKDVEKQWINQLKKAKGNPQGTAATQIVAKTCKISALNPNPIDVYSLLRLKGGSVELVTAYRIGGESLNTPPNLHKTEQIKTYLAQFAQLFDKKKVKEELEAQNKNLKNLQGKLKSLKKDNQKAQENIEKWKKAIAEAEANIQANLKNQEATQKEIQNQQTVVSEIELQLQKFDKK